VHFCFCRNFVKFPRILINFGRCMAKWLKLYAMYTFATKPDPCHYTILLNADVLNFYLRLDLIQSDCSDLVSKWRGLSLLSRQLSCLEATARHVHCAGCLQTIFSCFNKTAPRRIEHATPWLWWSETEMRETRRRLSACVRVHAAHLEHEFWQFWADLS